MQTRLEHQQQPHSEQPHHQENMQLELGWAGTEPTHATSVKKASGSTETIGGFLTAVFLTSRKLDLPYDFSRMEGWGSVAR